MEARLSPSDPLPDALCPPVVVFARQRLRDEAWRGTTLAVVAVTELALLLLAAVAAGLLGPVALAASRPYAAWWMLPRPEGWVPESPFLVAERALLDRLETSRPIVDS